MDAGDESAADARVTRSAQGVGMAGLHRGIDTGRTPMGRVAANAGCAIAASSFAHGDPLADPR